MIIFKMANQLTEYLLREKKQGRSIGFVPTMGALHDGHLTLIRTAARENDRVVCSIFINPTQFNNPEDFKHYPVTLDKDMEQLLASDVSISFLPPVEEIYPAGYVAKHYDLGSMEQVLEGAYRPGHFQGVCQVMDRLLEIVSPDRLYLGQKDYQQCMVIRRLMELTGRVSTGLRIVPTQREADGLAMSSRNLRLNAEQRKSAPAIFHELNFIKGHLSAAPLTQLKQQAKDHLEKKGFMVDYVEIASQKDLSPATTTAQPLVALAAASIGNIRLIDNLLLNDPSAEVA